MPEAVMLVGIIKLFNTNNTNMKQLEQYGKEKNSLPVSTKKVFITYTQ